VTFCIKTPDLGALEQLKQSSWLVAAWLWARMVAASKRNVPRL
jgi:hypothetical protein